MLGNNEDRRIDYALVLVKDYNQVEFEVGKYVKYIDLGEKGISYFKLPTQNLDIGSNYQLLAFPLPFKVAQKDYFSQSIFATYRISIN